MPTTYAIPDGRTVMAATLYTGTGSALTISNAVNGVSMQPDFIWIKPRSIAGSHGLFDSVRGFSKSLRSNDTRAEDTSPANTDLTAFNSNGFSVGPSNYIDTSTNGATVVAWQWKAGGAAVTNTAGSISSQVSANTTAGFSVVTWTGTGSGSPSTLGHGLGVAPSMVITKGRNTNSSGGPGGFSANDWLTYHASLGNAQVIALNSILESFASSTIWNSTSPTSSVFSIGALNSINQTGNGYVAYCYAPVAGYSAFGSYTGNGSTDGPFVYLGFRPRFVLFKRTDTTGAWFMEDTSRGTYNVMGPELYANSSDAEAAVNRLDVLSNGFKMRAANAGDNASGGTYIYAAFAENPFKYSNAR